MTIQSDFQIFPFSKTIRHVAGVEVFSMIAFHSWLMGVFDEPAFNSYEAPIKFVTPTSFNMLNGWFLDNGDGSNALQYLTGGSLSTIDYTTVADPVYMMDMDTQTGLIVASDKDKPLLDDAVAVGPILAFQAVYPVTNEARVWVRDTRATPLVIADSSAITVTGGAAIYVANGASVNGEEIYTNLFTIASFPGTPDPQVYVYQLHPIAAQGRIRIAEWSAFTNWDRGSIDVLIPVQLGGVLIDSGNVVSMVRQTGDTFTFVESDLSAGARTPIATETSADTVNVVKGEHYLLYDAEAGGGFAAGDVIQNSATGGTTPPTFYAEVVAVIDDGTTGTLTLRGLRGAIADNDALFVSTTQRGVANGEPGDTFTTYVSETTPPTAIDTLMEGSSSLARRLLKGVQDDGTTGKLVMAVDNSILGTLRNPYYRDFSASEDITEQATPANLYGNAAAASTTLVSGYTDVTVAHMNGRITTSGISGTFIPGERVTWNALANSGTFIGWVTEFTEMFLGDVDQGTEPDGSDIITGDISGATVNSDSVLTDDNTFGLAFSQQAAFDYSVFIEGGFIYEAGRSLADIYAYVQYRLRDGVDAATTSVFTSNGTAVTLVAAEEYLRADPTYAFTKPAPYGTLAGGVFFGAQAVWVQGMAVADANNIRLTDATPLPQQPFASVNVIVSNTRISDVITVFLEDGASPGLPDKSQFTSHATNNILSGSTFEMDASLPTDTPASGVVFVRDVSADEEHRYRYDSFTGAILTLAAEVTGIAEGGTTAVNLNDTGVFAAGVQRGDIIRNTTDASIGYIVNVVDDDNVTTTQMLNAAGTFVDWAVSDGFEINSLVVAYVTADKAFIPYLDVIEDAGSEGSPGTASQTILFNVARNVVVRVRNNLAAIEMVPFVARNAISTTGMSQAVIRTEDTVTT